MAQFKTQYQTKPGSPLRRLLDADEVVVAPALERGGAVSIIGYAGKMFIFREVLHDGLYRIVITNNQDGN